MITDQDAATLQAHFNEGTPEQQAKATALLNEWRVTKDKEQRATLYGAADDLRSLDKPNPIFSQLDAATPGAANGLRAKEGVTMFLARRYGKPMDEARKSYDLLAGDYAAKVHNEAVPPEPEQLWERIKPEVLKDRERHQLIEGKPDENGRISGGLIHAAQDAALIDDKGKAWQAWQDAAKAHPGWQPERAGKYFELWQAARRRTDEMLGPHRATVRSIITQLQQDTGVKDGKGFAGGYDPTSELVQLAMDSPDAYKVALASIQALGRTADKADKSGVMGFLQRRGEGLARGVTDITAGALSSARTHAVEGYKLVGADLAAKVNEAENTVSRDLREVANNIIDPTQEVYGSWWRNVIEGGLDSSAKSMSMMLAARYPAGQAALVARYSDDAYADFRRNGWSGPAALAAADGVGAFSAAVESLSEFVDKIPGIGQMLAKLGAAPGSKWATRFVLNAAGRSVTEFGEEMLQDMAAPVVQELAGAIFNSVPDRAEGHKLADEWATWTKPENLGALAVAVLPLAMVGAGISSNQEISFEKVAALTSNEAEVAKLLGADEAKRIVAIEDPKERVAAIQDTYKKQSAEQRLANIKASSSLEREKAKAMMEASAEAENAGVSISRGEDGQWTITRADGTTVKADSAARAHAIQQDLAQAVTGEEADAFNAVLDSRLFATADNVTVSADTIAEKDGALVRMRGIQPVEVITSGEQLEAVRAQKAGLGIAEDVQINGENRVFRETVGEAAGRIAQAITINKSTDQAGVVTALHEGLEGNFKRGLMNGAFSEGDVASAISLVAKAIDLNALERKAARAKDSIAGQDATAALSLRQRLEDVVSGKADGAQIRETAIELAVMDVMERDLSGRRTGFQAGTLTRAINSAVELTTDGKTLSALGKMRAWVRSVKSWLRGVLGTVRALQKAKESGKLKDGDSWTSFVDNLLNLEDSKFARAVESEAGAMIDQFGDANKMAGGENAKTTIMPDGAKLIGPATFSITAYHGTPHKVDKFTTAKIGTGEGAQAYGWGLYFAESRSVAASYQRKLVANKPESYATITLDGVEMPRKWAELVDLITDADQRDAIRGVQESGLSWTPTYSSEAKNRRVMAALELLRDRIEVLSPPGNLYTVELLPNEEDFLDWDKPLSEQSEKVKAALSSLPEWQEAAKFRKERPEQPDQAGVFYFELSQQFDDAKTASERLAALGIPGIRYLDGNSRADGKGSSNYVIFDESLVRILEENGKPATTEKSSAVEGGQASSFSLSPARRMESIERRLSAVLSGNPEERVKLLKSAIANIQRVAKRYEGLTIPDTIDPGEEIAAMKADLEAEMDSVRQDRDFEIAGAKEQKAGAAAIENIKRRADAKLAKLRADFDLAKIKAETSAADKNAAAMKSFDRASLLLDMATFEAATMVLPASIRAKIGGMSALVRRSTDEARAAEIKRRIEKIGPLLESYLRNDYANRIEKLLDKAKPERASGEKPKGKLGADAHEFFDRVNRVIETPLEDVEDEANKIRLSFEAELKKQGGGDPEKQMRLLQELSAMEVFGGTYEKSAEEMAEILDMLDQVYTNGRDYWKGVLEARRESDGKLRELAFAELGNRGRHTDQQKGARKSGGLGKMAKMLFSFRQILKSVFGTGSTLSDHFADAQTKAEGRYRDGVTNAEKGLHERLLKIAEKRGLSKPGQAMRGRRMTAKLLREWTTERNVSVRVLEGRRVRKDSMSLDDARDVLASSNKAWSKMQREQMQEQIDDADIAHFIGSRKGRKTTVTYDVVEHDGVDGVVKLTQAEAAYVLAINAQDDLKQALRVSGETAYTDDSIADIEGAIDPDILSVKDWMVDYLEAEHKPLSKAYAELHGVNLPHIPNYFPARFTHDGNTLAPELGGAAGGSLMQNGFTRQRKKHAAMLALDFENGSNNIFTVFTRHVPQVEHWKAYSMLVREFKSVLNSGMVQNAIKAKSGESDMHELNGWLGAVEMGGVQDAKLNGAFSDFIRKRIGAKSASVLGFRLSTLLVNTTGAMNAALDTTLPMRDVLKSYARVMSGKSVKTVAEIIASPPIQRRLSQGGNITSAWIKKLSESGEPNALSFDVNQAAGDAMADVDAKASAVALAAAYDAHYTQARASGADDAAAHEYAEQATERTAQKVLQPLELGSKSLTEFTSNPFTKLFSMFLSESRQKLALEVEALAKDSSTGKRDWKKAGRVIMVNHLVMGTAVWLIKSLVRDMLNPDDGEDDPTWEWEDWLANVLVGPMAGMPLVGTALESAVSYALQGFSYKKGANPLIDGLDGMASGAGAVIEGMSDVLNGDMSASEVEDALKGLNKLFGGIAVVTGTPAATGAAVTSNILTQLGLALNNLLNGEN